MRAYDSNTEMQIIRTICDSNKRSEVLARVSTEHFGSDAAKDIYNRILILAQTGRPIPSSDVMRNDEALSLEARSLLIAPTGSLVQDEDIEAALQILAKYRKARILLRGVTEAIEELKKDDPDIDSSITNMSTLLQSCHAGHSRKEMFVISEDQETKVMDYVDNELNTQAEGFIPSSFKEFDRKTGGFRRKNVVVLASVPGGGKSAMAQQMAINQYMMGFNVGYVSFEMDTDEMMYRAMSTVSKVEHSNINLKRLTDRHRQLIRKKFKEFIHGSGNKNRLIFWTPERELNMTDIGIEAKPLGLDIIYVDYLGLLKQNAKRALWENLGDHARSAKIVANQLNAAVVALAQLDDESNKLKYSKAILANAHFVWTWKNEDKEKESGIIEIEQQKARNADVYNFYLSRDFSTMSFRDHTGPIPMSVVKEEKNKPPKMKEFN